MIKELTYDGHHRCVLIKVFRLTRLGGINMLEFIGEGKSHNCNGTTRRDFLRVGTLGALGFSLPHYLWAKQAGVLKPDQDEKACIMIFNLGAPSQLDTFDMKPDAPRGSPGTIQTHFDECGFSDLGDPAAARQDRRQVLAGSKLLPYLGGRS